MTKKQLKQPGFGYATTPYRVEFRPAFGPHGKEELIEVLDTLVEYGVKAWWYSVSAKGSYPLFPSKVLPYREDAATDIYPWLVEEAHRRGISLFSWEYLSTAPLLAAQHPEWRFRYFGPCDDLSERDAHFVCYNSPYGQLLKDFCVEVVNELGFDGIWFDGSYLFSDHGRRMACGCEFCAEKYRRDTGREIPPTIDLSDVNFRRFIEWRYDDFTDYWRSLSGYVKEHNSRAIIVFNYFNRFSHGWESGSPLRRMPMPAMIASEVDGQRRQLLLQHKILRALNDHFPTEVWTAPHDGCRVGYPGRPNPEPAGLIFHAQISASAGGYASYGFGDPREHTQTLKALTKALVPIGPYIGGQPIPFIALVVSGATKDYAHADWPATDDSGRVVEDERLLKIDHFRRQAYQTWKTVHGMHNLLNALHLPSDVLLDNMLTAEFVRRYKAVVLPDVQCMIDEAAGALKDYVEAGGVLIVTGQTGTKTFLGEVRSRGVFDDLFRITWRDGNEIFPVMDVRTPLLRGDGLPDRYMISGPARLIRAESADVLAEAGYRTRRERKVWSPRGLVPDASPLIRGCAIVARAVGKGWAVYLTQNIGLGYAEHPNRRTREVIRRLLLERLDPPFTTDAPSSVVVNPFRRGDQIVFHLLNVPSVMLHFDTERDSPLCPEDFTPTGPIRIVVPGRWRQASSPTNGGEVTYARHDHEIEIVLARLEQHAVIVIT